MVAPVCQSQWLLACLEGNDGGRTGWVLPHSDSWEAEVRRNSILWAKLGVEEGSSASFSVVGFP